MKAGSYRISIFAAVAAGIFLSCVTGLAAAASPEQQRTEILNMRSETLDKLYRQYPLAKSDIEKSAGYAVFSNIGLTVFLITGAGGSGVAHDNHTGKDTYMNMASGGVGLGLGFKDFRGVFVFSTDQALKQFVENGWDAELQADVTAKERTTGGAIEGAVSLTPGIRLYQLTETGFALQATIQAAKYFPDDELNAH